MGEFDYYLSGSHQQYIADHIQPHGIVIAIDDDLNVIAVSENVERFWNVSASSLVDQPLAVHLPCVAETVRSGSSEALHDENHFSWAVIVVDRRNYRIIQLLPTQPLTGGILKERLQLMGMRSITEMAEAAVRLIKEVIGWDRVIFHQFFFDSYGKVIAESSDREEKLLGRLLPRSRSIRSIHDTIHHVPDCDYEPIQILGRQDLDLSDMELKPLSLVEKEVLRSFGSRAVLRMDIVVNHERWGMIEAQNNAPSVIGENVKIRMFILSHLIGQIISEIQTTESLAKKIRITELFDESASVIELFEKHWSELLNLLEYDGVVFRTHIFINAWGTIADETLVGRLSETIRQESLQKTGPVFCNASNRFKELTQMHRDWLSCITVILLSPNSTVTFVKAPSWHEGYTEIANDYSMTIFGRDILVGDFLPPNTYCSRHYDEDLMEFLSSRLLSKISNEAKLVLEERARRTEQRYRNIVENQADMVCRFNLDTTLTFVNHPWSAFFDADSFDAYGRPLTSFLTPEAAYILQKKIRLALVRKEEQIFDLHFPGNDKAWQQWILRPIFDDHGNAIEFQAVGRDISNLVETQRLLEERERRLSDAQRIGRFGDWVFDIRANQIQFSAEGLRILGFEPGDVVSPEMARSRIHPDDLPLIERQFEATVRNRGETVRCNKYRIVHPDGTILYVFSEGTISYDETGDPILFHGIMQDRTEEQLQLQRISDSKSLVDAIFNSAKIGICMVDEAGFYILINEALLDIYGYQYDEIINQHCSLTIQLDDKEEYTVAHSNYVRQLGNFPDEWIEITKSGRTIFTAVTASLYTNREGESFRISTVEDVTNQRQTAEKVSYLAHYDQLTGLPNRELFRDRLNQAIIFAGRKSAKVALLYIDLDNFKRVNDAYGHSVGDHLLIEVGKKLAACIDDGDTVARLGGDEFGIIAVIDNRDQVTTLGERILYELSQPFGSDLVDIRTGGSVGVSLYPDDGEDGELLLKYADMAMYRAKKYGRHRLQFYNSQINVENEERNRIESQLRRFLREDGLAVHYQPKIGLTDEHLHGIEALVRWPDSSRTPSDFIKIAEESGMINEVGRFVLRRACLDMKELAAKDPLFSTSVNVSPVQFNADEPLVVVIEEILEETRYPSDQLILEITENDVMHSSPKVLNQMIALNMIGVRFSIDDFGTGFSSLRYLSDFPFSEIKIDKSFVDRIDLERNAAIVRATISLAHALRLTVIAEGVETAEQVRFLRDHRCDQAQGYHFSRPLPVEALMELTISKTG